VIRRRPLRRHLPALAGALGLALCLPGAALALPSLPGLGSPLSFLHPHLPAWLERWLYNPRERTAAAIQGVARGDSKAAVAAADTALRLAPDAPLARYNAGSARLATGRRAGSGPPAAGAKTAVDPALAREAVPLLAGAVKAAGPELAADASYNLGNARLAAGDFAGAAEAYKQTLRVAPGSGDAKFNLELALREEQRQRQNPRQALGPRGGGGRPRPGDRRQTAGQGGSGEVGAIPQPGQPGRQPEQQAPSPQQGQRQGQNGLAQRAQGLNGQPSPLSGRQPLAGYQDQPEMSASEAAAVLEAVENLERQHRRQVAARQARQRAASREDW
jgi:tetratricopeptide (TPR) repeat protein